MATPAERIESAVALLSDYGDVEGAHHKQWVLDQVLRALMSAEDYEDWLATYNDGEDGPNTYEWDEGIAP